MYMKQDELNVNMESVRPELANYSHILYITIERLDEFIAASPYCGIVQTTQLWGKPAQRQNGPISKSILSNLLRNYY